MPDSPDRPTSIRHHSHTLNWPGKENHRRQLLSKEIIENTSAYHGVFTFPPDQNKPNFLYLNPKLTEILTSKDGNDSIQNDFQERLRLVVNNNDWENNSNPSFIIPIGQSEEKETKFYGLSIEKMGENQYHLTGRDITDKEIIRQRKYYEQTHEPMTGYLNSIGWVDFTSGINEEERDIYKPKKLTLFYIDLAGVKAINDSISHDAGDKYIIDSFHQIANKCFREEDIFARVNTGGDELVVCLPNFNPENIEMINHRLQSLRDENPSRLYFYFGSVNGTPNPNGSFDFPNLVLQADLLQRKDKENRKGIK